MTNGHNQFYVFMCFFSCVCVCLCMQVMYVCLYACTSMHAGSHCTYDTVCMHTYDTVCMHARTVHMTLSFCEPCVCVCKCKCWFLSAFMHVYALRFSVYYAHIHAKHTHARKYWLNPQDVQTDTRCLQTLTNIPF